MPTENWREIAGSPGYEVSDLGRVRSPWGRTLTPQRNGRYGYLAVPLTRARREYVHRLVAAAFLGDTTGLDVDHIDGDTSNNNASNLRLLTHAENMAIQRERKPLCRQGHPFGEDAIWSHGRRTCRTCARARWRRKRRTANTGERP